MKSSKQIREIHIQQMIVIIPKTKINNLIEKMDVLISFAQLKQHEEATVTASIKNIALGFPPALPASPIMPSQVASI